MTIDRYSSVLSAAHNRAVPVDNFEDNFCKGLIEAFGLIFHGKGVLEENSRFYQLNHRVMDSR